MTDKQIIVTFSDGYCIVLEDNKVSIRENEFTKLCIVVGNRTNELLEFVKNIYLDNKCKKQECEELKEKFQDMKKSRDVALKEYNEEFEYKRQITVEHLEQKKELLKQLDQLKAENDYLKHKIFRYEEIFKHSADIIKNPVTAIEVETFHSGVKALGNSLIAEENNKLHKTLTEIKELLLKTPTDSQTHCVNAKSVILQKISEVEDDR